MNVWKALVCGLLMTGNLYAGWLGAEVKEVRAYVYDYTQGERGVHLLKLNRFGKSKLHSGVINLSGEKLNEGQVARLKKALAGKGERVMGAFCYMPHHGFIFYGENNKVLGFAELCFKCGNVHNEPKGLPERQWDWQEITKILTELKIPILKEDEDYTALYEQSKK